ncbi:MAG: hypothetical protein EBT03_09165 [Betaproteobacteria bacterium]|nr:hypothetical protein [Betaproteobacteria bacterium]NCA17102.1 hypothetical protein [Betaproteobacteria bacterium]
MAGEWIPLDCNLGTKPEVLELVDETGLPIEVVCWRLIQLWSWAALNSSDGTIRATPRRVAAVAGGDETFWLAVERVGWVSFLNGNLVISGWDKRFSGTAKARAMHGRRQDLYRRRSRDAAPSQGGGAPPSPEEKRGEEKREEIQPAAPVPTSKPAARSPAKPAVSWSADAGWAGITDAERQEWATAFPGAVLDQELAKATAWLKANPTRAGRRNWRAFVVRWLSKCQERGGTNRTTGARPDDRPPPRAFTGEAAEAFERTRRKLAASKEHL